MGNGYKSTFKTINTATGEIIDGIPVYVAPKIHLKEGWFMGFQEAFLQMAKDKDMTGEVTRVLHYLFANLGFENYIVLPQRQIAEELNIKKENISRAMKILTEKGIIVEGPKLGRTKTYRLNNKYGWKGKTKTLINEREGNIIKGHFEK